MAHGVIGNTAGFGPVVLGSSPSGPTKNPLNFRGFFYCLNFIESCPPQTYGFLMGFIQDLLETP